MTSFLHNTNSLAEMTFPSRWLYITEAKDRAGTYYVLITEGSFYRVSYDTKGHP